MSIIYKICLMYANPLTYRITTPESDPLVAQC